MMGGCERLCCVYVCQRGEERVVSVYEVTKRQRVQLRGACINNFHSEKSNFLHLPANCSHADTLDWRDLSF